MAFHDLTMTLLRRWYVLVVALLEAGGAFFGLSSSGGVYSTQPGLSFTFPGAPSILPDNGVNDEGVIAFAATVAEVVNNGRPIERYAADDAPLYGAGAREEIRIGVPNVGGQWGTSFTRAEISISIIGKSEEWVREQQTALIARVREVAEGEQAGRGVPEQDRVTPQLLPLSTRIEFIGSTTPQKALAAGALLCAAVLVGGWAAVGLDRRLRHRASDQELGAGR
jgi:hypothetical protein